jgi:3-oxoacyl-[acyl-carrier-protein] synthase-1
MRRIVITGYGIVSSLGNSRQEVLAALRETRSGLAQCAEYAQLGLRSQVHGAINVDTAARIDRKLLRFMGDAAAYTYLAFEEALAHAGLTKAQIGHPRAGLIAGSGGSSTANIVQAADILRSKGVRKIGPYMVPRSMSSTVAACLATAFGLQGVSYAISSACATSSHCIGHAAELIQMGKQDIMFAGGGEDLHWSQTALFDAMGALSSGYNDRPSAASRPFDSQRDGFVITGGGGILVLEALEHAQARGAQILAELTGYGATSDGYDMVQPSGEGAIRCMHQALATAHRPVDYLNAHGTGTPVGDAQELKAIKTVFGDRIPPVSSTKALSGHALGAAGVHEAIFSLLMMEHDFIAASANFDTPDPATEGVPIVRAVRPAHLNAVMSNSFGFGGTNATLIFERYFA